MADYPLAFVLRRFARFVGLLRPRKRETGDREPMGQHPQKIFPTSTITIIRDWLLTSPSPRLPLLFPAWGKKSLESKIWVKNSSSLSTLPYPISLSASASPDGPSNAKLLPTKSAAIQAKLDQLTQLWFVNGCASFVKQFIPMDLSDIGMMGYLHDLTTVCRAKEQLRNLMAAFRNRSGLYCRLSNKPSRVSLSTNIGWNSVIEKWHLCLRMESGAED